MTRTPPSPRRACLRSRSRRTLRRPAGWLFGWALLAFAGALSPAISTASAQAPASITNATTGLSNASSLAPVAACAPSTPVRATCLAQILGVRGTRSLVHPRLRRPSSPDRLLRPRPRGSHAAAQEVAAAAAPQPGTPAYLQQAYDLAYQSQTGGAGTTIALVDAFNDPNAASDLAVYRAEFGLPACTTDNGCFSEYDQNGGTNYPTTVDPGWELEISLDLDAVSALCPNCHIALIEANSDQVTDLATAQMEAGQLEGVSVISDSWDLALSGREARDFATSGDYAFPGVTTVAASGDLGYPGAFTNDFPAALPNVTAAGGTTLIPASASGQQTVREFSESAWSGAGSGCNLAVTKPTWQSDLGCTGRSYADISADADPSTGMQVYDSDAGGSGWEVVGGTSEASPLIAAYYAVLGPTATAQGPSWAYANAALLNDPSTGSNGTCSPSISYICNAGPGYDGPTGVGSISGAVATGAPGITGPGTNGSYTQSVTADTAQLQGGVYPNDADTSYWWEYGPTTAYGEQTPATDIGSGSTPLSISGSLMDLQPSTTYHYRLVAQNSFGTEYGYDYTLTTAPSSTSSPTKTSSPPGSSPPPSTTPGDTPGTASGPGGTGSTPTSAPGLTKVRVGAGATNATVSATIAARGGAATYALQYGPSKALGRSISRSLAVSSSPAAANVTLTLGNLSPGRIYYFRVVASNAAGKTTSTTVRFKTSPITIGRITTGGNQLVVVLRCHGSAPCRVRLQERSGARVLLSSHVTLSGNRSHTVTLGLSRSFQTLATHGKRGRLCVLSTWNGWPDMVSATI